MEEYELSEGEGVEAEEEEEEEKEKLEEVDEEIGESEEEEDDGSIYTPFITALRELFTGVLSDVLPYTQNESPSTLVPSQLSHFRSVSA